MNNRHLLLGLLAALPALAQDGFKVGATLGLAKANVSSPMMVASYWADADTTSPYFKNVFAEYGTQTPMGLNFAMRKGDNEFALDLQSTSKAKDYIIGALPGYNGYGAGMNLPVNVETKLSAFIGDIKWTHFFPQGNHGAFSFSTGLRIASYKHEGFQSNYTSPTDWRYTTSEAKTDAYGLLAGFGYSYPMTANLSLGADLSLAFLQGDNKSESVASRNGSLSTDPAIVQPYVGTEKDRTFTQTDFHLHLDWKLSKAMTASVGYRYQDFGKVNAMSALPTYYFMSGAERTGGWGLTGLQLGVSYTF